MQRILTTWQVYLLFIPGILGIVVLESALFNADNYMRNFRIANLMWTFNILLILVVQAYLVISFEKATSKAGLVTVNAFIPVAYFAYYFLLSLYRELHVPSPNFTGPETIAPVRTVKFDFAATASMVLLVYSAVSFLFVNNWLIKKRIQMNEAPAARKELVNSYLLPMRRLVKAAVVVVVGTFLLWVIYDVVALTI